MRGIAVRNGALGMVDDLTARTVAAGQIEARVVCASVNPTDLELADGTYDGMLGQRGVLDLPRTGLEFSGVVTQPGERFAVGDAVFGYIDLLDGEKTHQERIVIDEAFVAAKPASMSFQQAAAVPLGAQTSLIALRDAAAAKAGERVLIHGASGGLGVYAVQIAARMLDLHVTAVAGAGQEAFLRGLGAHVVHDYNTHDILKAGETFDIVFDLTTKLQFSEVEPLLTPTGRFVPSEPLKAGVDFSPGAKSGERSVNLWVARGDRSVLTEVAGWVDTGALEVFVDSVFPFDHFRDAFARVHEHEKRGRIVLELEGGA